MRAPAAASVHAPGKQGGKGEVVIALTVLAALLAIFVFFMLSMFKP